MALDWAKDHFVRLYTRETDEDLLLSWEARALWHEFLKKADKRGLVATKRGVRGLAAVVRIPLQVVERVLPEILEDGRLRECPGGFEAPNYRPANYTPRAPGARMADLRERQSGGSPGAIGAPGAPSDSTDRQNGKLNSSNKLDTEHVTSRHESLPRVAHSIALHKQNSAVHVHAPARAHTIPSDWEPRQQERDLAAELGLDVDAEAAEFHAFWSSSKGKRRDWNEVFAKRLVAQVEFRRSLRRQEEPREIPEL